jgi:hypothetical protein
MEGDRPWGGEGRRLQQVSRLYSDIRLEGLMKLYVDVVAFQFKEEM